MNKKLATTVMAFYLLMFGNGYAVAEQQQKIQSATGTLVYFPSDVQSQQAWYGHNFMVGDVPVKPTPIFPSEKLLKYVGKRVAVSGTWNAGTTTNSSDINQNLPMPIEQSQHDSVVRNDGIMVEKLELLTDSAAHPKQ